MNASGRRLRVLFFAGQWGGGGAELHFVRVANALPRERFDVALVAARGGGSYERALGKHVRLLAPLSPGVRSSTGSIVRSIPALRALLRSERVDLVCSTMDNVNLAALLATLGMAHRPRQVLASQADPRAAFGGSTPDAMVIRTGIRRLYRRADCIVAISNGVAASLAALDPRLADRTRVIYNAAVDDAVRGGAAQPASRTGLADGERLLVACGRLHPQKDYPTLLRALAALRSRVPAVLWVLGQGNERGRLEALAADLGLNGAVRFLGFQANPWAYMAAADVFVLSSIYEGFGNVLAEAMACGAPVVATDCPSGPAEVLEGGRAGVLVPPGDPRALADALERVLSDPGLGRELRDRGRERALDFDAQRIAARYAEVFEQLVPG